MTPEEIRKEEQRLLDVIDFWDKDIQAAMTKQMMAIEELEALQSKKPQRATEAFSGGGKGD